MTRKYRNAGLPETYRVDKAVKLKVVCPVCLAPGIEPQGLPTHIHYAHNLSRPESRKIAETARADPMLWLGALEDVEERLAWVRDRLGSIETEAARESLRLAEKVLEQQRTDLVEAGHTGALDLPKRVAESKPEYDTGEGESDA